MDEATQYDVFLSHNSHDKPLVEQLAQRLVAEAKLRPFLDQWHLIPGDERQPELEEALQRSKTVAVRARREGRPITIRPRRPSDSCNHFSQG